MIVVKNFSHGTSFGGPFYYDISTIVSQSTVLPGLVDWYVSLYSPYHQRDWNEEREINKIKYTLEKRQKELLKNPNYKLDDKLNIIVEKELAEVRSNWEIAEKLLCFKENKDWNVILQFAAKWNGIPGHNESLMTRIEDVPTVWTNPSWNKKI